VDLEEIMVRNVTVKKFVMEMEHVFFQSEFFQYTH
jgi:hypothetical protein